MTYYSEDQIGQIQTEYDKVHLRYFKLLKTFRAQKFSDDIACEYANHGFIRRLQTLVRCLDEVQGAML